LRMKLLEEPGAELAARIRCEVAFEDRLTGYRLRKRMGPVPVDLYSFEEVLRFLCEDLIHLDWGRLERWLEAVIGDAELARAVGEVGRIEGSEQEKTSRVRELMALRWVQCRKTV